MSVPPTPQQQHRKNNQLQMSSVKDRQIPLDKDKNLPKKIPTEKISESNIDPRESSVKYRNSSRVKFPKDDFDLTIPKFMIDDDYVGVPPDVQVSINNLNDNVDEAFLRKELAKFGAISQCDVLYHPTTKAHLGIAKVQFEKITFAKECVSKFHDRSFMGKKLTVFLDPRYTKINVIRENIINPPPQQTIILPAHQALIPPTLSNLPFSPLVQTVNGTCCRSPQRGSLDDRIKYLLKQPNSGLAQSLQTMPPSYTEPHQMFLPDINKLNLCRTPSPIENISYNNELRKDTYNRNERNSYNNARNNYRDRGSYHHNHHRRSSPSSPIRQHSTTSQEEEKVVQREIPNNLTKEQIENVLDDLYRIFGESIDDAVFRYSLKLILEGEGYAYIDSLQAKHKKTSHEKIELNRRPQSNTGFNGIGNILRSVYAVSRERSGPPNTIFRTARYRENNFTASNIGRGSNDENSAMRRKNRSSALVLQSHDRPESRKEASKRDPLSVENPADPSSITSSESSSDSDSDSDSSEFSSFNSSSSDSDSSSSSSISTTRKRQDQMSPRKSTTPILKESQTDARPSSRSTRAMSEQEKEIVEFMISMPKSIQDSVTENTIKEDDSNQINKTDSDEDCIVKTSSKRKVLDEHSPTTERKVKRIRSDPFDLEKPCYIHEPSFDKRSEEDQNKIIDDIYGIDEEAFKYLMQAYNDMCQDPDYSSILQGSTLGSESANRAHLSFTSKKKKKETKSTDGGQPSWWKGCSRCDVIPRVKEEIKNDELTVWKGDNLEKDDLSKAPIKFRAQVKGSSRSDLRGEQRRFAVAHAETLGSAVNKFMSSSLQMRSKNLRFSLSKIHKWGLFACERIANGAAVIEYVGEKIRTSLADHREKVYANSKTHDGSSYFFRVDDQVIDATLKGNKARFINHSCNPNCIAKVIKHDNGNGNAIVIYASKTIEEEEEITYDYKFPREDVPIEEKIRCNCKASNCQKYLN